MPCLVFRGRGSNFTSAITFARMSQIMTLRIMLILRSALRPASILKQNTAIAKMIVVQTMLVKTMLAKTMLAKTMLARTMLEKTMLAKTTLAKTTQAQTTLAKTIPATMNPGSGSWWRQFSGRKT